MLQEKGTKIIQF